MPQRVNVLAREGEYWTVVFDGRVSRVRDTKGLRYLEQLLHHPGEEFHALALVAAIDAPSAPGGRPKAPELTVGGAGDAGPVLDATAVSAYRQRFRELQEELADAEECADEGRVARAQDEIDALTEQLAGGLGLGDRHRRAGSTAERARLAVTKAIRSTLHKLEQADPSLGRHLGRTVRTGTFCAYAPDPALEIVWRDRVDHVPPSPPPSATPTPSAPRSTSTFVGRPTERALVRELVAATAAGRGGLLLVSGEAGIGKTRLAQEALDEAGRRQMRALVGRCVESETMLPWLPLVEAMEQLVTRLSDGELRELLGGAGPEVAKVLPSLRRRLPDLPPPLDLPAEQSRLLLYTALRDVVLRLGAARPALLVLDDVHWADPSTLHMLEHLAPGLEAARVLVIATYRSDEVALGTPLARALEHLVRHPGCTTLTLGPFGPSEVTDLVGALSGRVPPPEVAARLCADADGNPFFVEQLLKHLAAEKRLYGDDGGFRPELRTELPVVPESLRLLLGHRLQRLSAPCRQVLDVAAVIGRDVDVATLTAAAEGDEDTVPPAVEEALAAGVLVCRSGREDDLVGFSHALLRQAALVELSPLRRARLHRRVAEALRRRHGEAGEHAAEIADHLERAGRGADAATTARFLELAARRSLETAAYEDAAARFRRALAVVGGGEGLVRARLLAGLGYAQRGLGATEEANASWLAALDLLEEGDGDPALAAELCRGLGRYLDATGGLDQAVAVLQRGLRMVGPAPTAERSQLRSALAYALSLTGDPRDAAASLEEAAAIAEARGDERLGADVLASRTVVEFTTGRLAECLATAEMAEQALLACGQAWDAVQVQATALWPHLWLGRVADARRLAGEILPVAERIGHLAAVFLAHRGAGLVDLVTGADVERFSAQAEEAVELSRARRLRWLADAHVYAGLARFWLGDWGAAVDHLRAAADAPTPPIYAGRYSAALLVYFAWAGDAGAFDRLLAEVRTEIASLGVDHSLGTTAVILAEVEGQALLGRGDVAAELYPAVVALVEAGLVLRPSDLRVVPALAGLAAGLGGDLGRADRHFDDARTAVATLPHPRQAPDVDFLQAVALLGGGGPRQKDRARVLLAQAVAGYRTLAMPRHRQQAEALRSVGG